MQKLMVGQIELFVLDDGTLPFPARLFFRDLPEEVWSPGLPLDAEGKIPVSHNFLLVKTGNDYILIDTGYGDQTHNGLTGHLLEDLDRTGIQREQVTKVITTHAHGDHIKANTIVQEGHRVPTFPNAEYILARPDWDYYRAPERFEPDSDFDRHVVTLERNGQLRLVDGEVRLTPEIRLMPTPGHTPGHMSVVIESGGETAIFLGDLCHHISQFTHPDWVTTFDTHPSQTPQSRANLFDFALSKDALLICPHAPYPGLGRLDRMETGIQWRSL